MSDSPDFAELLNRVIALTGLGGRDAAKVAVELDDDATPQDVIAKARELGFDVEDPAEPTPPSIESTAPANEISMDPAIVLAEVYENTPRVMCAAFPSIGRAPNEVQANEELMAQIDELPDHIRALLVKVDAIEGKATIWLRDEANDIDRPIGPIDLSRYDSGAELEQAIGVLLHRLPIILRSDWN